MKWILIFALVFSFNIHALQGNNDIKLTYQIKTGHTFYHDLKANSQKSKYFYNKPKKIRVFIDPTTSKKNLGDKIRFAIVHNTKSNAFKIVRVEKKHSKNHLFFDVYVLFAPKENADFNHQSYLTISIGGIKQFNQQSLIGKHGFNLVVFGDSLSDGGYFDQLLIKNYPQKFHAGDRAIYTTPNGKVWSEYLSEYTGVAIKENNFNPIDSKFVSQSLNGDNYAVGGATTSCAWLNFKGLAPLPIGPQSPNSFDSKDPMFHCNHNLAGMSQIEHYLQRHNKTDISRNRNIFIIQGGNNNIFEFFKNFGSSQNTRDNFWKSYKLNHNVNPYIRDIAISASDDIVNDVVLLHAKGAKRFIVWKLFDYKNLPSTKKFNYEMKMFSHSIPFKLMFWFNPEKTQVFKDFFTINEINIVEDYRNTFNRNLIKKLNALSSKYKDLQIQYFDPDLIYKKAILDHKVEILDDTVKFTNTNAQLVKLAIISPSNYKKGYLFYDGVHPTTQMHKLEADALFLKVKKFN